MEEEKEEQLISHSNEKTIDNKFINTTSKEIEEDIKELKNSRLEKTLS